MFPQSPVAKILFVALILAGAGLAYRVAAPRTKEVAVVLTATAPAERVLAVNGRVRPRLAVDIRSPVSGTLIELPFDVGAQVEERQIIARVDDAPEVAAIAAAQAAVKAQEAAFAQARRDLARFEALGEFAARQDIEQRRLAVEESARELARRQAALQQAKDVRDRRVLQAPFSGVIMERPVDPGQTVGTDTVIYRLADLTNPQVTAEVDEIYAAEITPGMEALVSLSTANAVSSARVIHIEPRVDPATGARDVRLAVEADNFAAPAGLTVTVNFIIERRAAAISIPRRAIAETGGKAHVRVIDREGIVADRPIAFIDWPAERVIVTSGLSAGEQVLANVNAATAGEKVKAAP